MNRDPSLPGGYMGRMLIVNLSTRETSDAPLVPQDALDLGASGMVTSLLLGYEEHIEANSMRSLVQWSLEGKTLGLPLVAEIQPTGPRVSHYGKAVELGLLPFLIGDALKLAAAACALPAAWKLVK